uniref:DENN domain-containing protein 1B n=1 Tax=Phallusia mammillata TaxID=59560 RepID=A0A6F9DBK3_9ASCI|nr:DENN domain-containing protein 1B [Phallusia mammillata]
MLEKLYEQDVPASTEAIQLNPTLLFHVPDPNNLPSIPENRNISEYYSALNPHCMIDIFASLMFERRVIFTSKNLGTLTSCVHSAEALLRPLHWQHIFIPVMPPHLLDYCLAPMPYLVGIHSSLMPRVRDMIYNDPDVVIANVDEEEVETMHNDVESIPNDVVSFLKSLLRKQNIQMGTNLALAFLRTQARLIGGFKHGLTYPEGEFKVLFDEDKFIESYRSTTAKEFAKTLIQLQSFKQFIDGRLDMLNCGEGFKDSFENECSVLNNISENDQDTVKEWLNSAKKGGNELFTQFKKKAKGNMKFARHSIIEVLKQQENSQQNIKPLNEATQRIRPSRPERPPPISSEKLQEMSPTRKYNTLDLGDDLDGWNMVSEQGTLEGVERDRSLSHFSNVDVNLVSEMETAIQDIVNTNSSNAKHLPPEEPLENNVDLMSEFSTRQPDSLIQEASDADLTSSESPKTSRNTSLKRASPVHKRPSLLLKPLEYNDEPLSPTFLSGTPTTPLVDLSVTSTPEKKAAMVRSDSRELSNDLLGLSLFPQTTEASQTNATQNKVDNSGQSKTWVTFDNEEGNAKSFNPFITDIAPGIVKSKTEHLLNTAVSDTSTAGTLCPEKMYNKKIEQRHPLAVTRAASQQVFPSTHTSPFQYPSVATSNHQKPSGLAYNRTMSHGKLSTSHFAPYRMSEPTAPNNPFHSNSPVRSLVSETRRADKLVRTGSLPVAGQSNISSNPDLFSDLLSNWKTKEGM